jgi:hypothetical protein
VGNEYTECRIKPEYTLIKYLPNHLEPRENDTCTLSFSVNRPPNGLYSTPITKWYKDGNELSENPSKYWFIEHGCERSLSIQNCNSSDSGLYKSFIIDESSEHPISLVTTNSCEVTVKKLKVEFLTPLEKIMSVKRNETVKVYCETVQENLKPNWYHNEILIETGTPNSKNSNKECFSAGTQHLLIINDIQEEDSGKYKLKFGPENEYYTEIQIEKSADYDLNAFSQTKKDEKRIKTEIVKSLQSLKCNEGEDIRLKIGLNRAFKENDLIEWKKNGEFLINSIGKNVNRYNDKLIDNFQLILDEEICELVIKNCRKQDSGLYEISLIELDQVPEQKKEPIVVKSKCNVNVLSYVEKSEIIKQLPRVLKLNEGDNVRLDCVLNKQPERISWYHNSIELVPQQVQQSKVEISSLDDGKLQILEIKNIKINQHEGTYQLHADDKISICEVKIKPSGVSFLQKPPPFLLYDVKKELDSGNDTLKIEALINKNEAQVKWFKGNEELYVDDSEKYEIVSEGPIRCLFVHDLNLDDSDDYFCSLGSEVSKTEVKIIPFFLEQEIIFEPKKENIEVYEGKGIVMGIDLDVDKQLNNCQWLKNGVPLNLDGKHFKSEISDKKRINLMIDRLSLEDSGCYELVSDKSVLSIIDLKVKEKPISIIRKLNAQKIDKNSLLLECEVSKPLTNQFKFNWSKDGLELELDNGHLSHLVKNGKICHLYINKFDHLDSGTYEFSVIDKDIPELRESTSFRLEIKQNPFKTGMRVVNTDMNETRLLQIELETVDDTFNPDNMKWLKNGEPIDFSMKNKYEFYKKSPRIFCLEIKEIDSTDNGSYQCNIDEFSNKLNLSGIENIIGSKDEFSEEDSPPKEFEEGEEGEEREEGREEMQDKNSTINVTNDKKSEYYVEEPESISENNLKKSERDEKNEIKIEELAPDENGSTHDFQNGTNITADEIRDNENFTKPKENLLKEAMEEQINDLITATQLNITESREKLNEILSEEKLNSQMDLTKSKQPLSFIDQIESELLSDSVKPLNPEKKVEDEKDNLKILENESLINHSLIVKTEKPENLTKPLETELETSVGELSISDEVHEKGQLDEVKPLNDELNDNENVIKNKTISLTNLNEIAQTETVKKISNEYEIVTSAIEKEEGDYLEKPENIEINKKTVEEKNTEHLESTKIIEKIENGQKNNENYTKIIQEPEKKQIVVLKPIETDKKVYFENDEINISIKIDSKVEDKENNLMLYLNDKKINLSESNFELTEIKEKDGIIYNFKIKQAKIDENDGKYELRIKENEQEIHKGETKIIINEKLLHTVETNWISETFTKEGEPIELFVETNKPIKDLNDITLYKDKTKLNPNDHIKISIENLKDANGEEHSKIILNIQEAVPTDTGKYKLTLADSSNKKKPSEIDLASTNLFVEEKPIEVLDKLKADKTEYKVNDDIILSLKLSKPLKDSEKCVVWTINGKTLDSKAKSNQLETNETKDGVVYTLKIKSAEIGKNDGEYTVKLLSKPGDNKSEFYSDSIVVKIIDDALKVLDSSWSENLNQKEGEPIELFVETNKPIKDLNDITLYKDKTKLNPNDHIKISIENLKDANGEEHSKIILNIQEAVPTDTGKYKLTLADSSNKKKPSEIDLASTNLFVEEKPIEVLDKLKADKTEYKVNDDIILSLKLSKPLKDSEKCVVWTINGKTLDSKAKSNQLETNETKDGVVYTLKIKSAEIGKNDGEYTVKLLSKPGDNKSEFYSDSIVVKIIDDALKVLDSSWSENLNQKEGEPIELFVETNKPIKDLNDITLYKDKTKLNPNDHIKISIENLKDANGEEHSKIILNIQEAVPTDTGKYKLTLADSSNKKKPSEIDLASTNLFVEEKPIEVLDKLKADKTEYKVNDDIILSLKLSKPLKDSEKCVVWTINGKTLDSKAKSNQLETNETKDGVVYTLKIKSAEIGKNDGEYTVKLLSKPGDNKSEFYSDSIVVKIIDDALKVLDSSWSENLNLKEGEPIELFVETNKPIKDLNDITLYKDKTKLNPNDHIKISIENLKDANGEEHSKIILNIQEAVPTDTGKYKLTLADSSNKKKPSEIDLASTNLFVEEKPIEVLDKLKADKTEYKVNDDIILSLKLSKPLKDSEKCVVWTINGKTLDSKAKSNQLETNETKDGVVYTLKIKSAEIGKNDGEYTVKLLSKPGDNKSEFYSDSIVVKIIDDALKVLDSSWSENLNLKEGEPIELFVETNKPIKDLNDITLYKDKTKLNPNDHIKISIENLKDANGEEHSKIILNIQEAVPTDTGKYKLTLADSSNKKKPSEIDLASTNLFVEEKPIEVLDKLKADKTEYKVNDDIILSLKLSKPLKDSEKCVVWTINGKTLDSKAKSNQLETNETKDGVVYTLKIKSAEIGKNDGEYTVKLLSKPGDNKSEFYSDSIVVKIIDDALKVLDSSWSENLNLKEGEPIELFVETNKPIKDLNDITLYKDKTKLNPNDHIKISIENLKDANGEEHSKIILNIQEAVPTDTGKYKLTLADSSNKKKPSEIDLASTNLFVEEKPIEVLDKLKADKTEYKVNDDIILSLKLSKPLKDSEKCVVWTINGKTLDSKAKSNQLETNETKDGVVYTLKIKSAEIGKNDGEYTVKLLSKPGDNKSEFYSDSIVVKIIDDALKVLDSSWSENLNQKEGEPIELFVETNKPIKDLNDITLYKDKTKLNPNDHIKISIENLKDANGEEHSKIILNIQEAVPTDTGKYKLTLADSSNKKKPSEIDLASTNLFVEEKPIEVLDKLKADKTEYKVNDDIILSLKLSKPLKDSEKCVVWTINGKTLDSKAKSNQLETNETKDGVVYTLKIKSAEIGKNDGEYTVKLLSKPGDNKSEFYSDSIVVKIIDDALKVLDSSWSENLNLKEGEPIELFVETNKPIKDLNDITLYKDKTKLNPNDHIKISIENLKDANGEEHSKIILNIQEAVPTDTGKYKLTLADSSNKKKPSEIDLASTNLFVEEKPIEVLDKLKADKTEYKVNDDIILSLKLSKPLKDSEKCVVWTINGKTLDSKAKSNQLETNETKDGVVYTLKIKSAEIGKNDGEYTVKLLSKPGDNKSEFYSDSIVVKIIDDALKVSPLLIQGDDIQEGGKVVLVARVDKCPKHIEWFKDDVLITPNTRIVSKLENRYDVKLSIDDLLLSDSGLYDLRVDGAHSSYQLIVNEIPLLISEDLKFEFNDIEQSQKELHLWCSTNKSLNSSDNNYLIQWFKDDILLETLDINKTVPKSTVNRYKQTFFNDNSTHFLSVSGFLRDQDCGFYEIKISSKSNKLLVQSLIEVFIEPDKMNVENDEIDSFFDVDFSSPLKISKKCPSDGENLKIIAKLTKPLNNSKLNVKWYVNSVPVEQGAKFPRYISSLCDDEYNLEIKPLIKAEEGCFIEACIVSDKKELKRTSVVLEKPLKLLKELKSLKANYIEGSNGEMACELSQKPINVKLFKNKNKNINELLFVHFEKDQEGQKINENDFIIEYKKGDSNNFKISIKNANYNDHSANYWLEFNDNQLCSNECFLNINKTEIKFVGKIEARNYNPIENIDKIEIEFTLNKFVSIEELNTDLQIIAKKPIKPEIIDSSRFAINICDSKDLTYVLTMKNSVSYLESGIYLLKLNSSRQESPNSLEISVLPSNLFNVELPERLEIFEEEALKLQVKCIMSPKNFEWLKDSETITKKERLTSVNSTFIYSVSNAKMSDSGVYEFICKDFNEKQKFETMKCSTKCLVVVKKVPEKQIKSLNDLGLVRVREEDPINLTVKFDKPLEKESIKVYLNDNEFTPEEHGEECFIKYNKENNTFNIQISKSKKGRDEGKFRIKSPNSESECQVLIEEKPLKIVKEFENVKLKILPSIFYEKDLSSLNNYSRTAVFECDLSKGYQDITWTIKDKTIDTLGNESCRYQQEVLNEGKTHRLTINNCSMADNGSSIEFKLNKLNKTCMAFLKVEQITLSSLVKIRKPLENIRVKEGDTAIFSCEVQLDPLFHQTGLEVYTKWFQKNNEIKKGDKFELNEQSETNSKTSTLKVNNCSIVEDVGIFTCQFYIDDKEKSVLIDSSSELFVKETELKIIKELPSSMEVYTEQEFELECNLSKPNIKVEWLKDGVLINTKTNTNIEITAFVMDSSIYVYRLNVRNSNLKDSGKYKIQFKGIQTECKVCIKMKKPEIIKGLEKLITVKETASAVLETEFSQSISNEQFNRVEWHKNGKRLYFSNKSPKYQISLNDNKCKLTIKDCNLEDEGDYELKLFVENDVLHLTQTTKLNVISLDVTIIENLLDISINEGETGKLSFKASKPCLCQWYKVKSDPKNILKDHKNRSAFNDTNNFEKIIPDDRIVFSFKADNTYSLILHDVQLNEGGFYLAHLFINLIQDDNASNESPLVITWAKLTVNQIPIDISIKFPDTLNVNEGSLVKLSCLLTRKPTEYQMSKIKVMKDGNPVRLSSIAEKTRYELNESDRELTFYIGYASLDDSGKYSLILNEKLSTICNVKIVPREDKKEKSSDLLKISPKILQDLKPEYTDNLTSEPFKIFLIVEGDDLRVDWFHDGKKVLPLTDQIQIVALDTPRTFEIVYNFSTPFTSDSGKYYCIVSNRYGSANSEVTDVQIKDPKLVTDPETDDNIFQTKPRFIEYFSDVYMESGMEAQFKCKIIGKPEPKVVWYCNCRKITANEKFELLKDETDHYTLIVKNANFNDEGEYTCKANNCKGETSWSANLYLNEIVSKKQTSSSNETLIAPNFLRKIKDSTCSEGCPAKFDCFIDGEPFPKISWFKNNSPIDIEKNSEKYKLSVDEDSGEVNFVILNTSKNKDEDEYLIKLENSAGVSQCSAYLAIENSDDDASKLKRKVRFNLPKDSDVFLIPSLEKETPKPPGEPKIFDYKTTSLLLKWLPSMSDNNYEDENEEQSSLTYIVEFRTSKSYAWSVYKSNIADLYIHVENLIPGLTYSFRIRAENVNGTSDASPVVSTKNLLDAETNGEFKQNSLALDSRYKKSGIAEKPSIIGESKDVRYYIEGETAEVAIPVFGFPLPKIKWTKYPNEILADSQACKCFRDRTGNEHLHIFNASEKNEGQYEIMASNEYGIASHQFYLQQADPPVFLEPFKDITEQNHENVTIVCKVDGIPYPEVKFYKDWHLLAESHRIKIKHIEPDTWIITINGAIIRDSGLYTCTAKNIAGGTLSSCNLNVVDSLLNLPHPELKTDLILFKRKKFEEDYEIVEQITQSSNSKVYRVIERRTAKEYIAKIAYKPEYTEWIKNEADCLNQLNQVNSDFVKLHDAYGTPSKMFILIFEEIKGKNLIEFMVTDNLNGSQNQKIAKNAQKSNGDIKNQNSFLEERKVSIYIKKLLENLNHLHSRNIVHLDINPDNIWVNPKTGNFL